MQTISRTHGFRLIELVLPAVLMAFLATVVLPDFSATIKNNQNIALLGSYLLFAGAQ